MPPSGPGPVMMDPLRPHHGHIAGVAGQPDQEATPWIADYSNREFFTVGANNGAQAVGARDESLVIGIDLPGQRDHRVRRGVDCRRPSLNQ